jgi:glycosyltransferase involved in cell wall biosynthesis
MSVSDTKSDLPVVSVIVPTYKGTEFLREAIDSILAQTYPAVEPIIINDGSPDNTAEVLAEYGDRIVAITQQNAGTAAARNRGLQSVTGQYVSFLDHDDLWHPQKLEKQMALFAQRPDAGMVICGRQFFDHYTHKVTSQHPAEASLDVHTLLSMQAIALQSVVIKKSVLDEIGNFDQTVSGADDWELTIRIAAKYPVLGVPECLVDIRGHEGQQSINSDYMYNRIVVVLDRYKDLHSGCEECRAARVKAYHFLNEMYYQQMLGQAKTAAKGKRPGQAVVLLVKGLRRHPQALARVPLRALQRVGLLKKVEQGSSQA